MSTLSIGPWSGGLNNASGRDLSPYLKPNELGIAINCQLTPEGFVEARPGFKVLESLYFAAESGNGQTTTYKILGTIYVLNEAVVVVQAKTTTNTHIYYLRGNGATVLKYTFANNRDFSSVLAINQDDTTPIAATLTARGIFLFSAVGADLCVRLEETPTFAFATGPTTMDATLKIPRSDYSFSVKDRTFLVDAKKGAIYWSATLNNCLWFNQTETEIPPDGSAAVPTSRALETGLTIAEPSITGTDDPFTCVEFNNNTFYLFKKTCAFIFSYQSDPDSDGYLRKISDNLGAFASNVYRNTVVIINNRGVFSVENAEFNDLQEKVNMRFETSLDNLATGSAFITNFNAHVLCGFNGNTASPGSKGGNLRHYLMNGFNKGWTEWDFNYTTGLAYPGSKAYLAQDTTGKGLYLFTTLDKKRVIFCDWKPSASVVEYALDGPYTPVSDTLTRYIPYINIQTMTAVGDSGLDYKKLYRTYIRLYISDVENAYAGNEWILSVNYNDYYFVSTNPKYVLKPAKNDPIVTPHDPRRRFPPHNPNKELPLSPVGDVSPLAIENKSTALYKRTYQVPIPQHRVKEFTFQVSRQHTVLTDVQLTNTDPYKRPVQQGFYFMFSGLWADYRDTARI